MPATSESHLASRLTPACVDPPVRDCTFYPSCLERDRPCGADGYALGYGERYCRRFLGTTRFSDKGLVWRDETMRCLQKRLVPFLGDASATCEAIEDAAFDDHAICYSQPHASICDLPARDWVVVVEAIDVVDLLSRRGRKQVLEVARRCARGWLSPSRSPAPTDEASDETSREASEGADADTGAKLAIARALEADPETPVAQLAAIAASAPTTK